MVGRQLLSYDIHDSFIHEKREIIKQTLILKYTVFPGYAFTQLFSEKSLKSFFKSGCKNS